MLQSKDRVVDWIKKKSLQYAAYKRPTSGTSLAVQWLRLCASTTGGTGSIPGWELRSRTQHGTVWPKKTLETHFRAKETQRLKVREWKKVFHGNGIDKKVAVALLVSDKIDFKTKAIKKDK